MPVPASQIVLRKGINVFSSVLSRIESQVSPNCIKHLNTTNYQDLRATLAIRPMFSVAYIVYVDFQDADDERYRDFVYSLIPVRWIYLIIQVGNKDLFSSMRYDPRFNKFTFLDCYNVSAEVLNNYIRYTLVENGYPADKLTLQQIEQIRKRARYKEYVLDSILPVLARTDLSRKTINLHIAPYTGVTLSNIGAKFFVPKKKKSVASYLMRYRRYINPIYKEVLTYARKWLELYPEFASGALSESTVIEWTENRGKSYNITYTYQADAWLDSFSYFSYDFMAFVFMQLQMCNDAPNSTQLITLYKIYRMVN